MVDVSVSVRGHCEGHGDGHCDSELVIHACMEGGAAVKFSNIIDITRAIGQSLLQLRQCCSLLGAGICALRLFV